MTGKNGMMQVDGVFLNGTILTVVVVVVVVVAVVVTVVVVVVEMAVGVRRGSTPIKGEREGV